MYSSGISFVYATEQALRDSHTHELEVEAVRLCKFNNEWVGRKLRPFARCTFNRRVDSIVLLLCVVSSRKHLTLNRIDVDAFVLERMRLSSNHVDPRVRTHRASRFTIVRCVCSLGHDQVLQRDQSGAKASDFLEFAFVCVPSGVELRRLNETLGLFGASRYAFRLRRGGSLKLTAFSCCREHSVRSQATGEASGRFVPRRLEGPESFEFDIVRRIHCSYIRRGFGEAYEFLGNRPPTDVEVGGLTPIFCAFVVVNCLSERQCRPDASIFAPLVAETFGLSAEPTCVPVQ